MKRSLLVAEAYAGKVLGGVGALLALPLRLLPWFKKKRVTDTYLLDPHVTGYQAARTRFGRPAPGMTAIDARYGDPTTLRRPSSHVICSGFSEINAVP